MHSGKVAPLDRNNIDTDQIIPKQFLRSIKRTGFGVNLFDDWRYMDNGDIGMDNSKRPLNSEFVLNDPRYAGASILLTRDNFGCGSSREHAVWALVDYGFRVVVAASFGDIFYGNAAKNGLLPATVGSSDLDELFRRTGEGEGLVLTVDLENSVLSAEGLEITFDIDEGNRERLLQGLDDITLTLQHENAIKEYEAQRAELEPWVFGERN